MKRRILTISIFILAFNLIGLAQENTQMLDGIWFVEKVTITSEQGESTYYMKETKEPLPFLKEFIFEGNKLTIKYGNTDSAEEALYTIVDNILIWNHFAAMYKYIIDYNPDGSLMITYNGTYGENKKYLYHLIRS